MREINAATAAQYLRDTNRIGEKERIQVRELAGGVSNVVLYVAREGNADFVLKQARQQLRVPDSWYCSVERIWSEVSTMRLCKGAIDDQDRGDPSALSIDVPEIVFEDRDNYAFAMTAAPPHEVWKEQLLNGRAVVAVAKACGQLLASLHATTWQNVNVAKQLGDTTFFHDLRIDPYYEQLVRIHANLESPIRRLIGSLETNRRCLVHGDFSPKNLLVHEGGVTLVDCEVGHYGDPAFDLGFFLSHLMLKAIRAATDFQPYLKLIDEFWQTYQAGVRPRVWDSECSELSARATSNLAACALARVDGKSQVDYLDKASRERVRRLFMPVLLAPPIRIDQCLEYVRKSIIRG